jgi:hypothetical protein
LEDEREKRVLGACKRKLLKLSACATRGMRTAWVLENPDVALTNFTLVHDALMASLRAFPSEFEPNEVYLVDTPTSGSWTVYVLRLDGRSWPHFEYDNDDEPFPVFDSAILADLTGAAAVLPSRA